MNATVTRNRPKASRLFCAIFAAIAGVASAISLHGRLTSDAGERAVRGGQPRFATLTHQQSDWKGPGSGRRSERPAAPPWSWRPRRHIHRASGAIPKRRGAER